MIILIELESLSLPQVYFMKIIIIVMEKKQLILKNKEKLISLYQNSFLIIMIKKEFIFVIKSGYEN